MFAKINNIAEKVTDIITGVVKEFDSKGNTFILDVHFSSFFESETKKPYGRSTKQIQKLNEKFNNKILKDISKTTKVMA